MTARAGVTAADSKRSPAEVAVGKHLERDPVGSKAFIDGRDQKA